VIILDKLVLLIRFDSSGTWEKKTIVFPEDITGVFDNDNNGSLGVFFGWLLDLTTASGTLNTSWAASVDANRVVLVRLILLLLLVIIGRLLVFN
jgi:hypothetical protein